jgi:membrane protease YdiL (CAAX protease family)
MTTNAFDWEKSGQLSVIQLLLATFIPSAIAFTGFRVVLPALVKNGTPVLIGWPSVASVMLFGFVLVAIFLLRAEAKQLGISLWARMCFKKLSLKEWGLYIVLVLLALAVSMGAQGLVPPFMDTVGLTVPDYMPFFLNPKVDPTNTDVAILSPDLQLQGNYSLLLLVGVTLFLNILAEELYFRAWILPKLTKYGAWGWVMNGVLFALYHTFQLWLLPALLVASLFFAFIFYKSKSIWPSLAAHLIGNFLLSILGVLMLILG